MKFKIIISDLDGTLLTRFNRITKNDLFAISRFIRNGGDFIFATGRSIVSVKKHLEKIELISQKKMKHVICFNGAYVKNLITNEIFSQTVNHQYAKELYEYAKNKKINIWMYTKDATEKGSVCTHGMTTRVIARFFKNLKIIKPNENSDLTSYKLNLFSYSGKKMNRAFEELSEKYKDKLSFCHTHPQMIEINAKGVNKGQAIEKLLKDENIDKKDVIAFGDSNNDLQMFKVVEKSIAIKTKSKELEKIASYKINKKRNGVAKAINAYVFTNTSPIKLIAVDLDGTLLENDSKLTNPIVKEKIKKAVNDYKIPFALATGRSVDDCLIVIQNLNLDPNVRQFIIASNGALVYDVNNQQYLFSKTIDQKIASKIFEKIKKSNNSKEYGTTGAIIYNRSSNEMHIGKKFDDEEKSLRPFYGTNHKFVLNCLTSNCPNFTRNSWAPKESIEVSDLDDVENIVKFVLYFEDTNRRDLFLKELEIFKDKVEIAITSKRNIEITGLNVNKGVGLKVVSSKLDINLNETLPIGDEGNDIEMLKLSKYSVTLASSREEVRKSASIVYDEKPSFIVGKALEELVLK